MQRNSSTETRKASVNSTSHTACPELSLNHVAIAAPNPERSMAFYAAFGFTPDFAKHDAAGQITLQQMRRGEFFVELLADQDAMAPGHFGLHTADLDALLQHLDAQGLQPLHPVQRGVSGVLWTFFEDPAGNRVEVTSACHD